MYENMKFQHLAKHNTDDFHKGGIRSHKKKHNTGLDVMKVINTAASTRLPAIHINSNVPTACPVDHALEGPGFGVHDPACASSPDLHPKHCSE